MTMELLGFLCGIPIASGILFYVIDRTIDRRVRKTFNRAIDRRVRKVFESVNNSIEQSGTSFEEKFEILSREVYARLGELEKKNKELEDHRRQRDEKEIKDLFHCMDALVIRVMKLEEKK